MLFTELNFFFFLSIVAVIYYLIPKKIRYIWLLLASLYFYASNGGVLLVAPIVIALITWTGGKFIEEGKGNKTLNRLTVLVCSITCFGILFFYKYLDFAVLSANRVFEKLGFGLTFAHPEFIIPLGISFFTFQSMSYVIDLSRGEVEQEKNFLRYLLFVCFFPTILSGPILKAKEHLKKFSKCTVDEGNVVDSIAFNLEQVRGGLVFALWGLFIKVVLADRLGIFVNSVFDGEQGYHGLIVAIASVFYTFQIYFDFAGYSCMAIGVAKALGFELGENFRQPYFATSIKDFWRRWHISLSTWFRDYLYIPLGGNRIGTWRKRLNLMITFVVSGLWHGAGWNFVIWGGLHGVYQVAGELLAPVRKKMCQILCINTEKKSFKLLQTLCVFCLVSFAWIFFRANGISTAIQLLGQMCSVWNPWVLFDGTLFSLGLDGKDFVVLLIGFVIVLCVDKLNEKESALLALEDQNLIFRWLVYFFLVFSVLIFGVYGPAYNENAFIYFQF